VRSIRVLVILLLAGSGWWGVAWIAARALIVDANLERAEVVMVLAGAPFYRERFLCAVRLFQEMRAPAVLLTNDGVRGSWSRTLQRNPLMVERAKLQMIWAGVPADRIEVLPGRMTSTYDEAVALRDYLRAHRIKSVLVVTSAYHTRRALWTMRRVLADSGVQIGIEPAEPLSGATSLSTWWWHRRGWQLVGGEYVKLAYYRWHYA